MLPPITQHHHYVLGFTAALAVGYVGIALFRHTGPIQRLRRLGGDWTAAVIPRFLAIITFLAGALLLFSGATPAVAERLQWLGAWIPLPILELSHFIDNLAGVMLLILARGVERRLDVAYHLTIGMLIAGIFLSLLRALDIEQALVLTLMLVAFVPSRKYFYRKSSLVEERFSASWVAAILLVTLGSIALGLVSYANLRVSSETFFRFGTHAEAARFLRASAGVLAALIVFAVMRLLRTARTMIPRPTQADLADARELAGTYHQAAAQLAFLGDKSFLFNEKRTGFIMFGVQGRSWVALGDPISAPGDAAELIMSFIRLADQNSGWAVFYKVAPTLLYLYLDHGLNVVKLGEEARVSLTDFSLEGANRRNLRRVWRKMTDDGYTVEIVNPKDVAPILPQLRAVSDQWIEEKRAREKSFSLGAFAEDYVVQYPIAVARKDGQIIAFSNAWVSGQKAEVEADLMRYTADAPPGIMRFVLIEMMLWARGEGYAWFNLGMASLSGLNVHRGSPVWNQLAVAVRGYGERFYNFQGIREFKQWFYPEWEPLFLASPGGAARPIIIANIASLVAGDLQGVLKK
ncbi:MAG: phosphatidylglycerol lysyltransferase domain-containing protein [Gemmatimonadota bacterium]|nr:phosphatidylglycerol lysyltransferase domain-containing protein [Gemmatimonadota bacterium]